MFDPVHLLMVSASAQMTFVCLLGWVMLVPRQLGAAAGALRALCAFGVNAFRLGGDRWQRFSAALAGTSSLALTGAWLTLFVELWS